VHLIIIKLFISCNTKSAKFSQELSLLLTILERESKMLLKSIIVSLFSSSLEAPYIPCPDVVP